MLTAFVYGSLVMLDLRSVRILIVGAAKGGYVQSGGDLSYLFDMSREQADHAYSQHMSCDFITSLEGTMLTPKCA